MERKVVFRGNIAQHTEPLGNGLAVVVTVRTYIGNSQRTVQKERGPTLVAQLAVFNESAISVWQGGVVIAEARCEGELRLRSAAKSYSKNLFLTLGDQIVRVGFSGKVRSVRRGGWFPKFLHVKMEPA